MTRYFGTDGVRGVANKELTTEVAFALGLAAVEMLGSPLVIGRDTRRSGTMLESALVAGITAAGGDALLAGIIPTPAVAYLTSSLAAAGGIVISASHNPPIYNGIKFFDARGFKLSAELEETFEQRLVELLDDEEKRTSTLVSADAIGTAQVIERAAERYIEHALQSISAVTPDLEGLTIVVDCGHGASSVSTPQAFARLKARVHTINNDVDGDAINVNCGSTKLDPLMQLVSEVNADIGIAHDGDADRIIAVDANAKEIDGDYIEIICAQALKEQGALPHNTVVSTVMANLGFTKAARELGIDVIQTAVGDSNVLAAMREGGFILGGEQSGHMIFLEHNTTGDGLITALQLLAIMKAKGKSLSELAQVMQKYPQVLINVRIAEGVDREELKMLKEDSELKGAIEHSECELEAAGGGRVLIRPSGTEPLIRVMVEAATDADAQKHAVALADILERRFGAGA